MLSIHAHVSSWHFADKPVALGFVRFWATADNRGFWPAMVCPLMTAGSTGRRNTGVKSLCRGFELQGLAWPFVELTCHFVQMGLRVRRQVGSLRKVLSQQTIGVLV